MSMHRSHGKTSSLTAKVVAFLVLGCVKTLLRVLTELYKQLRLVELIAVG